MPTGYLNEPRTCQEHAFTTDNLGKWMIHKRNQHGAHKKPRAPKCLEPGCPVLVPSMHPTGRCFDHEHSAPENPKNGDAQAVIVETGPAKPSTRAWLIKWTPQHLGLPGAFRVTIEADTPESAEAFLREACKPTIIHIHERRPA